MLVLRKLPKKLYGDIVCSMHVRNPNPGSGGGLRVSKAIVPSTTDTEHMLLELAPSCTVRVIAAGARARRRAASPRTGKYIHRGARLEGDVRRHPTSPSLIALRKKTGEPGTTTFHPRNPHPLTHSQVAHPAPRRGCVQRGRDQPRDVLHCARPDHWFRRAAGVECVARIPLTHGLCWTAAPSILASLAPF